LQYIKCIASKPGIFNNVTINFDDKITTIYGKNGSGKSIIASALIDFITDEQENLLITDDKILENFFFQSNFTINDSFLKTKEIPFEVEKKYSKKNQTIKILNGDTEERNSALKKFYDKISMVNYINFSFIPSVSNLHIKSLRLHEIEELLIDDFSNFYNFKKYLENKILPKNSNFIKIKKNYEIEFNTFNKKIQLIDIQNNRLEKLLREENKIKIEIKNFNIEKSNLKKEKEIIERIKESLISLEAIHDELLKIKETVNNEQTKISKINDLKNIIIEKYPQFKKDDLKNFSKLDKLQTIYNEVKKLNEDKEDLSTKKKQIKNYSIKLALFFLFLPFGINFILYIANSFSFLNNIFIHLYVQLAGIPPLLGIIIFYFLKKKDKEATEKINNEKNNLLNSINDVIKETKLELKDYRLNEIYEFLLQYFEDFVNFNELNKEITVKKSELVDKEKLLSLKTRLKELNNSEIKKQEKLLQQLQQIELKNEKKLDIDSIESILLEIDEKNRLINDKINLKNEVLLQIENEMENNQNKNKIKEELIKQRDKLEEKLLNLNKAEKIIFFTNELLEQTIEKRKKKKINRLIELSLNNFNYITANKYFSEIDSEKISSFLEGKDTNLNSSMNHILIISIKLAASNFLVDSEISLPLIMDEPFLLMDNERISKLKELLIDISKKRQIIIFTHKEELKDFGYFVEL